MNILLSNNVLIEQIKDFYAKQGIDVTVNTIPVIVENHYEVICDTAIVVSANGEKEIINNDGLRFILDSQMRNNGLRVVDASCNTKYIDGKPHFVGVNALVNNEKKEVYGRSR